MFLLTAVSNECANDAVGSEKSSIVDDGKETVKVALKLLVILRQRLNEGVEDVKQVEIEVVSDEWLLVLDQKLDHFREAEHVKESCSLAILLQLR